MENSYELAIVGGGIAGVGAAVYAKRAGLNFVLLEPSLIGGQISYMDRVDNYIGLGLGVLGEKLARSLKDTLAGLKIEVEKEEVKGIETRNNSFLLSATNKQIVAKSVIIASGAAFKKLEISGEKDFTGKGVSYCAVCDGFFFKNKKVAVVGGGNTAVEEALYLSEIADSVVLIHRRDRLRAMDYLQKSLKNKNNITVLYNHKLKEVRGQQKLSDLVLEDGEGRKTNLAVDGLFVAIGVSPNTAFCQKEIKTDSSGFIITDEKLKTSLDSVWACGDCRQRPLRQLITAASEGAIASIQAYRHLRGNYLSI